VCPTTPLFTSPFSGRTQIRRSQSYILKVVTPGGVGLDHICLSRLEVHSTNNRIAHRIFALHVSLIVFVSRSYIPCRSLSESSDSAASKANVKGTCFFQLSTLQYIHTHTAHAPSLHLDSGVEPNVSASHTIRHLYPSDTSPLRHCL
jgi:hypothetical protein